MFKVLLDVQCVFYCVVTHGTHCKKNLILSPENEDQARGTGNLFNVEILRKIRKCPLQCCQNNLLTTHTSNIAYEHNNGKDFLL